MFTGTTSRPIREVVSILSMVSLGGFALAAYRTLEVDPAVNNEDLTRAYRRLMSRHHPDKLKANGLPDSMLEHAKQRTQAIREAYELLRQQRGMS